MKTLGRDIKTMGLAILLMIGLLCGVWALRMSSPVTAHAGDEAGAWWNFMYIDNNPVPLSGWQLDPEIPGNYIPVLGMDEVFMVLDADGNIIGYRQRVRQADGSWLWHDINPDIPEGWEPVPGLDNVFRVVSPDGTVRYYRYHRNDDDTFFFEEVDSQGNPLWQFPEGSYIPDNFVRVTGNIYAILNEHGVIIAYAERVQNADGSFTWRQVDRPDVADGQGPMISGGFGDFGGDGLGLFPGGVGGGRPQAVINIDTSLQSNTVPRSDGGFTRTEVLTESRVEGGFTIIEETTVTLTYNSRGDLISSRRDGPHEVSRVAALPGVSGGTPSPALVAATISDEDTRVSAGLTFDTALANEVLGLLNAARAAEGMGPLSMASGNVMSAARIKAADMAIFNHGDFNSPTYGTISNLFARFGITAFSPAELLWRTSQRDAATIHDRFQADQGSWNTRMFPGHSSVAIAIVVQGGQMFYAEIYQ